MTASETRRREFLGTFLDRLNEATATDTEIDLDIYFVIDMVVERTMLNFEFDANRGFYDETMDVIEIADALL